MLLVINIPAVFSQIPSEELTIQKEFLPGIGLPLGRIIIVEGEAVIVHHHETTMGYMAQKGLPLYPKDKIITNNNGRVSFQLKDGSQISMSSNTTLTINKSLFDSVHQYRSVFMSMPKGKCRLTVKKLINFKRSDVKMKTTTALIGVRGSDFFVMASEKTTEIVTLDETVLEVNSLFDPFAQAVILKSYERSEVDAQELPTEPETIQPEEIDRIIEEFSFGDVKKRTVHTGDDDSKNVKQTSLNANATETAVVDSPSVGHYPVIMPEDIIEFPESIDLHSTEFREDQTAKIDIPNNQEQFDEDIEDWHDSLAEEKVEDWHDNLIEINYEDEFDGKLPELPGKPSGDS